MRLEYFQLIDRIVDLDLDERTIRVDAQVPDESTIFEGHFPGHPLMPGVLLIETMAQTSGWLVIAATKFNRMPFLAAVKEAKLRSFVTPGQLCRSPRKLLHDGSGFAVTKAAITRRRQGDLRRRADACGSCRFPTRGCAPNMEEVAARIGFPAGGARSWLKRAREAWITGIGIVSCLGEGLGRALAGLCRRIKPMIDNETFAPYIVHPLAPIDFDKQIPKKGDQRQMEPWQRIGTYAAGLALDSAGCKGNAELLGRMDMIVAAGGGERDEAVDGAILTGLPKARTTRHASSTSG